jgi:hypothetical protein
MFGLAPVQWRITLRFEVLIAMKMSVLLFFWAVRLYGLVADTNISAHLQP